MGFIMMRTHDYAKLHSLWEPMMAALGFTCHFNFEDPSMEQSLYQEVFEMSLQILRAKSIFKWQKGLSMHNVI